MKSGSVMSELASNPRAPLRQRFGGSAREWREDGIRSGRPVIKIEIRQHTGRRSRARGVNLMPAIRTRRRRIPDDDVVVDENRGRGSCDRRVDDDPDPAGRGAVDCVVVEMKIPNVASSLDANCQFGISDDVATEVDAVDGALATGRRRTKGRDLECDEVEIVEIVQFVNIVDAISLVENSGVAARKLIVVDVHAKTVERNDA